MQLRELKEKDASLMLEWMHDKSIVEKLHGQFTDKTIDDCLSFIRKANGNNGEIHLAVCNEKDEYMGTVSLKNIDFGNKTAEFAIAVRNCAMGNGFSWFGMQEILRRAFEEYGLESVYWCVSKENVRALRFYDKHSFHEIYDVPKEILDRYADIKNLKWYSVLKGDKFYETNSVVGCKVIKIKTIPTIGAGELSFFEANQEIGFDIKRFYYISKVPKDAHRGFHAHKNLKQLLFCPYGRVQLVLENELGREIIELSDPSIGVLIDRPTWREMVWLEDDSVLCVAASDFYNPDDYIRNYDEFLDYIK